MTSTDAIAAKERICFDHEQVRDQNKCVAAIVRAIIKALAIISLKVMIQPRCVVGPRVSPAYFKLTAWIAANVYAYVHGHTRTRPTYPQSTMRDKFENFINFIFNNQCTIDC